MFFQRCRRIGAADQQTKRAHHPIQSSADVGGVSVGIVGYLLAGLMGFWLLIAIHATRKNVTAKSSRDL